MFSLSTNSFILSQAEKIVLSILLVIEIEGDYFGSTAGEQVKDEPSKDPVNEPTSSADGKDKQSGHPANDPTKKSDDFSVDSVEYEMYLSFLRYCYRDLRLVLVCVDQLAVQDELKEKAKRIQKQATDLMEDTEWSTPIYECRTSPIAALVN
ncbi:hypothetical protein EJ08DRAFT_666780 [Tothia fuscella]|uniref:Uncharacterized protein n=1 Tax=Tothia fuscella TaxID=1048955 RepID=A0A9P4NE18_9PEZI|nr:hypothetical protein EJ08DRAFT_666780 [Tothia fuscella]